MAGEPMFRPGEAATAIGIKGSTLRVYSQRFADLLSDDATAADRPGYRLYRERDVALLRQARELLERGFTYERAAQELRGATAPRPRSSRASAAEASLGDQVAAMREAVSAWRALADERAAEIASLREEIRALREMVVATGRRATPVSRLRRH